MLILSRKVGESIVIDGRIVVHILQINRDSVRVGTEAPSDVTVHRKEVHDSIQRGDIYVRKTKES